MYISLLCATKLHRAGQEHCSSDSSVCYACTRRRHSFTKQTHVIAAKEKNYSLLQELSIWIKHTHGGNSGNLPPPDETCGAEERIVLSESSGKEFVRADSSLTRTLPLTKGLSGEEIFLEFLIFPPFLITHSSDENDARHCLAALVLVFLNCP